jgi:PleD family two-component response regulator
VLEVAVRNDFDSIEHARPGTNTSTARRGCNDSARPRQFVALMEATDEALYDAKRTGKNRLVAKTLDPQ